MRLSMPAEIVDFDPYTTRTEAGGTHATGDLITLTDNGRKFRYGFAGASNITRGKLQQAPAPIANHANLTTAAAALDATTIVVTLGATAAAVGEYNEGLVSVNDVDGEGSDYLINSHAAAALSTALTLKLADPIVNVALTANSQCTLVHNQWSNVIEDTSATKRASGVPLVSILTGDFGWFQTSGVKSTLIGSAATLGAFLMSDASTAGAVTDHTDVTAPQAQVWVGQASIIAGVSTEFQPIVLTIDK